MPTSHLTFVLEHKGIAEAYNEACQLIREHRATLDALWGSRFFEMRVLEDGSKKLWPITEDYISRTYDEQDLTGEEIPPFFYCDEDGQLYPVTIGDQSRINQDEEAPFHYASSSMIANGKVVGNVIHTDH